MAALTTLASGKRSLLFPPFDPHAAASRRSPPYALAVVASLLAHCAILAALLAVFARNEADRADMLAGGPAAIEIALDAADVSDSAFSAAARAFPAPASDETPRATEALRETTQTSVPPPPVAAATAATDEPVAEAPVRLETAPAIETATAPAEQEIAREASRQAQQHAHQARLRKERLLEERRQREREARLTEIQEERQEKARREKERERARLARATEARAERADIARASRESGRGAEATNSAAATRGGTTGAAAGAAQIANWRGQVLAHLARYKQYPSAARDRGVTGRPLLSFSLAPSGAVLSASLVGSSGSPLLDQAALAMVHRAAPFPPMPAGAGRANFNTAINFDLR